MRGWQHEGNIHGLGYLECPDPSTEIILHILRLRDLSPALNPHTHFPTSFILSGPVASSRCHHCTACSLAVLPESWGFITSGSSGGLEKASMCSCSNISSGGQRGRGEIICDTAPRWPYGRIGHVNAAAVDADSNGFFCFNICTNKKRSALFEAAFFKLCWATALFFFLQ